MGKCLKYFSIPIANKHVTEKDAPGLDMTTDDAITVPITFNVDVIFVVVLITFWDEVDKG